MSSTWLELVGRDFVERGVSAGSGELARPARDEAERYLDARRAEEADRARRLADCERRIDAARAEVFAAGDGVVTSRMTELEREWRRLARRDRDEGLMELWARIAPASWHDRKVWRDAAPEDRVELMIALAADPARVEAAERAVGDLRDVLAAWGTAIAGRVVWSLEGDDFGGMTRLLERPFRALLDAARSRDGGDALVARARHEERQVLEAVAEHLPARPVLGAAIAHAASLDGLFRALAHDGVVLDGAPLERSRNPAVPLLALFRTGFCLVDASATCVELATR